MCQSGNSTTDVGELRGDLPELPPSQRACLRFPSVVAVAPALEVVSMQLPGQSESVDTIILFL